MSLQSERSAYAWGEDVTSASKGTIFPTPFL